MESDNQKKEVTNQKVQGEKKRQFDIKIRFRDILSWENHYQLIITNLSLLPTYFFPFPHQKLPLWASGQELNILNNFNSEFVAGRGLLSTTPCALPRCGTADQGH